MSEEWYSHEREERRIKRIKSNDVGKVIINQEPPMDRSGNVEELADTYLQSRQLCHKTARAGGWYGAWHRGPRVIIPCRRTDGGSFWQGRLLDGVAGELACNSLPRWDSPHGYRGDAVAVFLSQCPRLFIVEGPMDALACAEWADSVALLGATPPEEVLQHVGKLATSIFLKYEKVYIIPDMDRLAMWQRTQLRLGTLGVHAKMILIPGGYKDLAEMPRNIRREFFESI